MSSKRKKGFKLTTVVNRQADLANRMLGYELMSAGYVEIQDVRVVQDEISVKDFSLEERLRNWGYVVTRQSVSVNVTAAWAADYVSNRNAAEFKLAVSHGLIKRPSIVEQIEIQATSEASIADAWLIESAWSCIGDFNQKQALKMMYVSRLNECFIRRKLRLRGQQNLKLLLWRAKSSLQQVLARQQNGAIIQPNNLTAASRA